MPWFLYILECRDNSYYIGITLDIPTRVELHHKGKGSKYVRSRLPATLVYSEVYKNKSQASKRENLLKGWPRNKKIELIKGLKNHVQPL